VSTKIASTSRKPYTLRGHMLCVVSSMTNNEQGSLVHKAPGTKISPSPYLLATEITHRLCPASQWT